MVKARALLVVAIAATLALAGCSGGPATTTNATDASPDGPGDGEPGEATTATGTPGALDGVDAPPWLRASGVNATRLVDAHYRTLAGESYRVETTQAVSGVANVTETGVRRVDANGHAVVRYETTTAAGTTVTDGYVNDSWAFTRTRNDSRTVYSDYRVDERARSLNASTQLERFVALGDFAVNRTFQVDGETRIEYVATAPATGDAAASVDAYRGRLVVSTSGRIHALEVTATQSSNFGNATTRFAFDLAAVGGVDPEKPDWVSTARQRAITVDLAYENDDGAIAVTHDGGETIPAGTQVVVAPAGQPSVYFARLPDEFSAGETIHLAPTSDRRLVVSTNGTPDVDGAFDGTVRVAMYAGDGEVVVRDQVTANATASRSRLVEDYPNQN